MFWQNLQETKNGLSFAGLQTLLASENEFNSTGNFNSTETVGDAPRLCEWPSGLYSFRNVTEVKLGRVRSNSRWVTLEARPHNSPRRRSEGTLNLGSQGWMLHAQWAQISFQ